jgi:hypothetical protein
MNANEQVAQAFIAKDLFGIDPGKSNGGIVKYNGERYESWPLKKMNTFEGMVDFFKDQSKICKLPLVFLEKITSFAGDYNDPTQRGRIFQMNKLKEHYVEIKSALKISGIPFIEVMPMSWMKYLQVHIAKEERAIRKKRFICIAKDEFPGNKVVGWNADAFLLIAFGRKKLKYDPRWINQKLKENQPKNKLF